jgi:small acid-soluble spore protein P (minor)
MATQNFIGGNLVPKNIPQPVPEAEEQHVKKDEHDTMQEPLSGSKTVKNRNHSRQNKGGGSAM